MSDSFLGMSDDDFLKESSPAGSQKPVVENQNPPATEPVVEVVETPTETTEVVEEVKPVEASEPEVKVAEPAKPVTEQPKTEEAKPTEAEKPTTPEALAVNYEESYKQIMAPFKANGKMIELKSPQEAIQLMQQGANYTRKMQELAPHRRVLITLENNGLLQDQDKLAFAIDLLNKNPDAIKKLVKDSGIDPNEIDTSVEPAYQVGNHRVSDEEVKFRATVDDLRSNPAGIELINSINSDWDQTSKDALWSNPEVLQILAEQRANGIYTQVASEIERRRILGVLPASVPFLQAYQAVGQEMATAGAIVDAGSKTPVPTPSPAVVATRVAAPRPVVTNNDRAAAAATTRNAPGPAKPKVDYLSMSDDEFLKLEKFQGRV